MDHLKRIYTDCSGDACPPDGRYDTALKAVVAVGSGGSAEEIADQMIKVNRALDQQSGLDRESAIRTAQHSIEFWSTKQ